MPAVAEFFERRVVIARPSETLRDTARRMLDERIGCVVVVEDRPNGIRAPVAILTDCDILVSVLTHAKRHVHTLTVADVMAGKLAAARRALK